MMMFTFQGEASAAHGCTAGGSVRRGAYRSNTSQITSPTRLLYCISPPSLLSVLNDSQIHRVVSGGRGVCLLGEQQS